jgi:hypothetical protein
MRGWMRFLAVKEESHAQIFGEDFHLRPLDSRRQNLEDILATDDFSASELLSRHRGLVLEVKFDPSRLKGFPRMCAGVSDLGARGSVLVMKNGGIGDHVLFLPVLEAVRKRAGQALEILVSVQKEKHPLYRGMAGVKSLLPMPVRLTDLVAADFVMDFSVKGDPDFRRAHMTDYFLRKAGIPPGEVGDREKAPRVCWDVKSVVGIARVFDRLRKAFPSRRFVLLNWQASNVLRDLPPEKLLFLPEVFKDVVFIIARAKQGPAGTDPRFGETGQNLVDLTREMETLESYMAAIGHCDAVVTTDTGTGHLAEAIGRPSLILYGPTRDDLWIKYYKRVFPLRSEYRGETCSSPCGLQKSGTGCPESFAKGTSYSPCLLSISKERIIRGFEDMISKIDAGAVGV